MSKSKKQVSGFLNKLKQNLFNNVALPALAAAIQIAPGAIATAESARKTIVIDGVSSEIPLSGPEKFKLALNLIGSSMKIVGQQLPNAALATTLQVAFLNSPLAKLSQEVEDDQQGDIPISTLGGTDAPGSKEKRNKVMAVKP